MEKRSGFTLIELLIAIALSTMVLGLALNQLMEYFRLQQVLITRTQLRQEARGAMDRISQHMRYCPLFGKYGDEYIGLKPLDEDHDSHMTKADRYELVLWRVMADPFIKNRRILQENSVIVPAFLPTENLEETRPFFDVAMGHGRRLASFVQDFSLTGYGTAAARIQLDVAQQIPKQKDPVTLRLHELVAIRSHLIWNPAALPPLKDVLDEMKKKGTSR